MNLKKIEHDGYTVFVAELQSRSRKGVTHYTRIVVKDGEIINSTCDCEAYAMRKQCWHISFIKKHLFSELSSSSLRKKALYSKFELSSSS